MSYYTIFSTIFQCQNMNKRKNPRTSSHPGAIRGLFYSCSKLNRYLRAILQRINQTVIAIDGNFIDHSVPELFGKLDGCAVGRVVQIPPPQPKKDSIVDWVSAMEFCFIYGKRLVFALKPLFSVVPGAFFLIKTINPPSSAPQRQKWRILYRSRVQSFKK